MGQSTDAILVCGIDFGEDFPEVFEKFVEESEEDFLDFDKFVCEEVGLYLEEDSTDGQFDSCPLHLH